MVSLGAVQIVALFVIIFVEDVDVGEGIAPILLVGWSLVLSITSALFGGAGLTKFVKERETVSYLFDGAV
jgi:hypothetical protein